RLRGVQGLVLALVDQLVSGDPGHHRTQLGTDLLDLGFRIQATAGDEGGRTGGVFQNEVLGIFAGLDVLQALAHSGAGLVGDDARPGDVVAVVRGVGNGRVDVGVGC